MRRTEIRLQMLALVAAVAGLVSFGIFAVLSRGGSLVPRPPVLAGILVVVMGGLIMWLARPVRHYLQGRATSSLDPLRAARTVVLAQAGAITGAAVAGWYSGQLAVVLTGLDLLANQARILPVALMIAAALGLCGAGLVAQHWCRIDPPDDGGPQDAPTA